VNLEASTITVRHTVMPTEDGYRPTDAQKSQRAARTVHLDKMTVDVLGASRGHSADP
jgi:hypothetical protein